MKDMAVQNDNGHDIEFTGEEVASTTSANPQTNKPRWTELHVYKTDTGKFVCHEVGCSTLENVRDFNRAGVCVTHAEIKKFFGLGWLAKEIYDTMGIDVSVRV